MTFPQYYRTVEEFAQPLTDTASPVYRAGLRIEQSETRVVPCPYAAEFRQHGDAERFAREYIPTLRSWTESTFLDALSQSRPLDERQGIIDRYYGAYQTLVRENPVGHGMDYVHAYMSIAKIGAQYYCVTNCGASTPADKSYFIRERDKTHCAVVRQHALSATGEEHRARIVLPDGFEYKEAENANMVSFEVKAQGLAMRHTNTYAQLNAFDWSN